MNRRTLRQRLLYHHLSLAVASAACCLLVFALVKSNQMKSCGGGKQEIRPRL